MKKCLLSILILHCLPGCMLYDCGYSTNCETTVHNVDETDKMPLTYSLDFDQNCKGAGLPTEKSLAKKIETELALSGLFSEVTHADDISDGYHLAFAFHVAKGSWFGSELASCVCYPLLLIPITTYCAVDLQATLYLYGKPIWSTAHVEKCRYIICIYALPVGLVMNYWSVWHSIEKGLVNSTVNDFSREHRRRFLDNNVIDSSMEASTED